ncbi:MAG: hypothetical protein K6F08_01820 [bacterium]|nr:hypothetical protein [bacterium]
MTLKERMKQYNFWISLVSAVLLVARILGTKFGFEIDSSLVMDVTTGLCGVFVVLGIISAPQKVVTKIQTEFKQNEITEPKVEAEIVSEPEIKPAVIETKVEEETREEVSEEKQESIEVCENNADVVIEETKEPEVIISEPKTEGLIEGEIASENSESQMNGQSTQNLNEMNKEDLIEIIQTLKNN